MPLELTRSVNEVQINSLMVKHEYERVSSNENFVITPSIVHMGGFKLHTKQKGFVRIINKSNVSQRLHILGPTSPYFKIDYKKKVSVPHLSSQ